MFRKPAVLPSSDGGNEPIWWILRKSYCHSLVLFTISPARILIKNVILSILSNVYGPFMFLGLSSSKDDVTCTAAHLLGSLVAPADGDSTGF